MILGKIIYRRKRYVILKKRGYGRHKDEKYIRERYCSITRKTNYNEVMVIRSKLSDEDIEVINFFADQYQKNVMFASMHEALFNENDNPLVLKY